jgi:aminopeptidase YwaD
LTTYRIKQEMKKSSFTFLIMILFITGAQADNGYQENNLRRHVKVLTADSLQGRGLGTTGAILARDYIAEEFRNIQLHAFPDFQDYIQPFQFRQQFAWLKAHNVIGYIEGSDPDLKNEYLVIGAHYDHLGFKEVNSRKVIFPGADDNASGVAVILELARHFAIHSHLLKRSLIFIAFDAEESGLKGSEFFIENTPVPAESIKFMMSFDMVGMLSEHKGIDLVGIESVINGFDIADKLAQQHNIKLKKAGAGYEKYTDTAPFGIRGIPSVHVYTGQNSPYHKPQDRHHLLDYEGMVKVFDFCSELIYGISSLDEIKRSPRFERLLNPGAFKLYAGISTNMGLGYHRYNDEFYRAESLLSFSGGFFTQLSIGKIFTLQQEVLYDINRSRIEEGKFQKHSLTFPFHLQAGTPRSSFLNLRAYFFAGPYYRYSFSGSSGEAKLDFNTMFDRHEYGYSLGTGIDIFRYSLSFTHRRALTKISLDKNILDTQNYLSVGFKF